MIRILCKIERNCHVVIKLDTVGNFLKINYFVPTKILSLLFTTILMSEKFLYTMLSVAMDHLRWSQL